MNKINLYTTNPERHEKRRLTEPDLKRLIVRMPQKVIEEAHAEATALGITTSLYVYAMFKSRNLNKIEKSLGDPGQRKCSREKKC